MVVNAFVKAFTFYGLSWFIFLGCGDYRVTFERFDSVKAAYVSSELNLLDRNGIVIDSHRVNPNVRRLAWESLDRIPPHVLEALLIMEDRRFYKHKGVDYWSLLSGIAQVPFFSKQRGASTLTMQLVSFLHPRLKALRGRRTFWQKYHQAREALALEKQWSKSQILEAYLNLSHYRGELQGIGTAAQGLLQKEVTGLSKTEGLLLIALLQSPDAPPSTVVRRACIYGKKQKWVESCASLQEVATHLEKPYQLKNSPDLVPVLASRLLKHAQGSVQTTLDGSIQQYAAASLQEHLQSLKKQRVEDGAILVLENKTGNVLAYVANTGAPEHYYVDGVRALRQAGSTLKPFLYALAFEAKVLVPSSILEDSPLEMFVGSGSYRPQNYDEVFRGNVSARVALASSLNIPAVRTLNLVGVEPFVQKLKQNGISSLRESDFYGPSLALGSADVSLWDLTNAYRTLANGGKYSAAQELPHHYKSATHEVYSPSTSYLIANILSDRSDRGASFGFANTLSGRTWFAAKTGTSKDMRDNWCLGFSDRYTVGVWVGNFSGEPMWNVSGVSGAAPVFSDLMAMLHKDTPSLPPKRPRNVQEVKGDLFLAGTASAILKPDEQKTTPKITYPPAGTIFVWDPDIPEAAQKIIFEANRYETQGYWKLNDEIFSLQGPKSWKPNKKGKYKLSLLNLNKKSLDTVDFEVR